MKSPTKKARSYLRWSTNPQSWGDSERRQMALATDYCQRHGLELADKFTDSGLSAFKGKNQAGQLGKLITQLQPGDHLLVEDTDRLSRQGWVSIGRLLDEITSKGAVVVILRNELKITADNLNRDMGVIMQTVMGATLGSEESQKKSERIAAVYEAKRQAIRQGKATKMNRMPCWLEWDDELEKPILNEAKAAIVRQLFELACAGQGILAIVRQMLSQKVPPVTVIGNKAKPVWSQTAVRRILLNKAAIGFYTVLDPPVPGYWPPVVSDEIARLFQRHFGDSFDSRCLKLSGVVSHRFWTDRCEKWQQFFQIICSLITYS